jgi:hypothetical protein
MSGGETIELTIITKDSGPLTKRIFLGPDGKVVSDGSACSLAHGKAKRLNIDTLDDLAPVIESLGSDQAFALGTLRDGLADEIPLVTDKNEGNGSYARTKKNFVHRPGLPAPVLLDFDIKGMPKEIRERIDDLGGFWPALVSALPALKDVGHLTRASTSAGIFRADTGERFEGSGGLHVYIIIEDGTDSVRFLKVLHDKC